MASVPAVPEFRDADQCRQHGLEIIRPKPRRLGDLNRPHDTRMPAEGASLRASHRDLVGGSAPSLNKLSVRDLWPSPSGRSSHEASPRPCLSASSPGPPGSNRATPVRDTTPGLCGGGGGGSRASPGSLALSAAATRVSPAHNKLSLPEAAMTREQDDQLLHDEGFSPDPNFSVYRDSASNTDCGSLSKSSSDGDPVVSRRKPLARLKSRRRNILSFPLNPEDPRLGMRRHDLYAGGSSSDENRSSGHASMSDGGQSSYASSTSPPTYLDFARGTPSATPLTKSLHNVPGHLKAVPEDDRVPTSSISASRLCRRSQPSSSSSSHGRRGYRSSSGGGYELHDASSANLDDIRLAVEQLAARTQQGSCSGGGGYSTSTYSSDAEPGGGTGVRRLMRHSSLETIATNITSAEEFVWVDNLQARLVEMQRAPWTNHDVLRVLQSGRLRDQRRKISMEVVPRLSFLLQRPLVRVAREAQRLSRPLGVCGKRQVSGALCVVLSPALAESCVSACHRAAAMYTSSSSDQLRLGKSARAGLQLPVGRFQRWACDARLAPCVHEYGALYLTAAAENLLEELVLRCLEPGATLTAAALEAAIAGSGELWGLFQPFAHLNAGRTATGALSVPRWPHQQPGSRSPESQQPGHQQPSKDEHHRGSSCSTSDAHEQSLLTTCVGSTAELSELLGTVTQLYRGRTGSQRPPLSWGPGAVHALYHYMRCSQLEHAEHGSSRRSAGPELIYERPYQVLPPLVEWVRVAHAHAEYRRSPLVDQDDVMQAARLLLPGVDCPVRAIGELHEERLLLRRSGSALSSGGDESPPQDWARQLQTELAFRLLSLCGQQGAGGASVVSQALPLLPSASRLDTRDQRGLTPLMLACARGDEAAARLLVQAGADIHAEAPLCTPQCPLAIPEVQGWTALTFATTQGMVSTVRMFLEKGANVEGSGAPNEEKVTETPLQLAVAFSHLELIGVLLSYGAKPFCATPFLDAQSYGGAHPRGCYGAAAVAAAHGRRSALRRLLAHRALPEADDQGDVLSLHEILAEGAAPGTTDRRTAARHNKASTADETLENGGEQALQQKAGQPLSKAHVKALQEAMYQSAENGYLEVTLDLRSIGVPWTLHCWMQTLTMAHEQQLENTIDELLQDFLHVWPEDCSTQFVDDCLPLLFSIFRHSKNEGTTLLLADIFSVCYGEDSIKEIRDVSLAGGARIDPKYVNNPEMSDVQFRVEGRAFYAHKIILVNASPRFKAMLATKSAEGSTPVVQINDIRYDIFQLVMQYLYKGGCEDFDIDQNDVLELLTAATFFQLDGLVRFCEARCSKCVDLDNVVATYVHAKVYNAVQLLEYCQGFLLQNLVALLSYDDGVRKLLFGKRLHNHDVLSGLLLTLQARVKQRVALSKVLAGKRAAHDAKMRLVGPTK